MVLSDVDRVLGELARLEGNPNLPPFLTDQIKNLQLELRFLKALFGCFAERDAAAKPACLGILVTDIAVQLRKAGKGLYAAGLIAIQSGQADNWNLVVSNLMGKVESFKPEIAEICLLLLDRPFLCNFSTSYEILEFINIILENLKDLINSKVILSGPMEMQIRELQQILWLLKSFVHFASTHAIAYDKLEDFWNHIRGCANRAASVSLLFWVGERVREGNKSRVDGILSDLVQKIEPFTLEVIEMYLGVLKASKSSRPDTFLIGEVVASFVDFLLKNLPLSIKDDITEIGESLMFLLTFLMDPPELSETGGNLILRKIDAIVSDIASFICSVRVDGPRTQENKFPLELFQRIDEVRTEIKELYLQTSDSSLSNFPKTNGLGYINFLLGKIDEMLKCEANVKTFGKYQIVTIRKELAYLQSFLKLRNEHNEVEDIWMQIINVAYTAEHVIDTSLIMDASVWYRLILLSDVRKQMKRIKLDAEKMEAEQMNFPFPCDETMCRIDQPDRANILTSAIVGFEEESREIIGQLIGGSQKLEIVSIVGMAGIGKSTLAMKVFNHPVIRLRFFPCVWCHVSQVFNHRKSLLNILNSVSANDQLTSELNDEDLAAKLYRCLRGRKFLFVLDDLWDIKVWHQLKVSFPDDQNGSRILLTSRTFSVPLPVSPYRHLHVLHPFSDEESWKLLKGKLDNVCPPELEEVGQRIAKYCKGLPLAIVLIADILARKEKILDVWEQIAGSLNSFFAAETSMAILELSYKHLPDVLKSCFLYFATLQGGEVIKVKRLCRLWIAEGFVPKTEGKSLEDVANEYLMDLISRNLVTIDSRSFSKRIKECHVHGLLHSFCVTKAEEDCFSKLVNTSRLQSNGVNCEQYRLCIQPEWSPFVNSKPIGAGANARSLLFRSNNSSKKHPYTPEFFGSFLFLRVLDLEGLHWGVLFPQEVVWLTHLRYLAIGGDFTSIPSSIDNLSHLETLSVQSHDSIVVLPNTICSMKSLRDVDIPTGATISWDDFDHEKSSCLNNLVTFSLLFISRREDAEMLLKMVPRVRRLRFQFSNQFPVMDFLDHLECLNVQKVGRALKSYLHKLPHTLRELSLSNLRLPWEEMSAIAKLPNLEALKLLSRSFEGLCWDMRQDPLCRLKFLKLESLNIAEWIADSYSLPCLQRLAVKGCVNLGSIPDNFGDIPTLGIIEIHECSSSVAESARYIREAQYMRIRTLEVAEEHSSSSHIEEGLIATSNEMMGTDYNELTDLLESSYNPELGIEQNLWKPEGKEHSQSKEFKRKVFEFDLPGSRKTKRRPSKSVPVIQTLYDTCNAVFGDCGPGHVPSRLKVLLLKRALDRMTHVDVGLEREMPCFRAAGKPPITYLRIYECNQFSIGIFCLPPGAVIPLHNYPQMTAFSKLLFGTMHIRSYDLVDDTPAGTAVDLKSAEPLRQRVRLAKVKLDAEFTASRRTSILYPADGGNIRCLTARTPCAVLDVLGPPYSDSDGRHCKHYLDFPFADYSVDGLSVPAEEESSYAWLQESDSPEDFVIVAAIYNGPKIVDASLTDTNSDVSI